MQNDLPDPDPMLWRDLALDLSQQELRLADYMHRIQQYSNLGNKGSLGDTCSLRDWANSVGAAVSMMRKQDWIEAKVHIDKAYASSLSVKICIRTERLFSHNGKGLGASATQSWVTRPRCTSLKIEPR